MDQPPKDLNTQLAVVETKLETIAEDVVEIKTVLTSQYVSRNEFAPVRALVYGMVGSILLGVITALGSLILRGGAP